MSKPKKLDTFVALYIALAYIVVFIGLVALIFLTSCQTPSDPLKNAEFDCECIYKSETDHAIKFKCQDGEYHFIDPEYNRKYKKGDVINQLNK